MKTHFKTKPFLVIGLCGLKGSGKSRLANALYYDHNFQLESFAGPIRKMAEAIWPGFCQWDKEVPRAELHGRTPRYVLQTLGTEWGRELIHPDIWASRAIHAALTNRDAAHFVFDDVRFANEALALHRLARVIGGVCRIFQVHRHDHAPKDGHPSEAGLPAAWVDGLVISAPNVEDDVRQLSLLTPS